MKLKSLVIAILISSSTALANDAEKLAVGIADIVGAINTVETAKTKQEKDAYTDIAINAGGAIGSYMDSYGDLLIKNSEQALRNSEKLTRITEKLQGLLGKYDGLVKPDKLDKLKKVTKFISDKSDSFNKSSEAAITRGNALKAGGKALSGVATVYFFSQKMSEYDQKRRDGNTTFVDDMKIAKDASVAVVSTVAPIVGVVDLGVDIAEQEIDRVGDINRGTSSAVAYSMNSIMNKHINLLRNSIKERSANGEVVSRSEIDAMYRTMSQQLRLELIERKEFFEKQGSMNSIFDGDVGIIAYERAISYADRVLDSDSHTADVNRLERISALVAIDALVTEINTQSITVEESFSKLSDITADVQHLDVELEKVHDAIANTRILETKTHETKVSDKDSQLSEEQSSNVSSSELDSKKQEAETLLAKNQQRASEYEEAYHQYKNDPDNPDLKLRVDEADRLLRESTAAYIAKRDEVQALGGGYTGSAYSRDSIRGRIDNEFASIGEVAETDAAVDNSNNLATINSQINSKQAELNNLQQELSALGGSSSSVNRFKVRSLLIKYRLINQIYDKYNGDITKVSAIDKSKLKALAKTLPNNWVRLFQNAPTRYANAQAQATLIESSNVESQRIVNRINQLQNQIASLSNEAGQNLEQQSQYESSRQDLISLVNDSNDATKENLGSDSGVEGGGDNGGGGTGGGNDDDRGLGDGDPVDDFPNLGYVSGKGKNAPEQIVSVLFTTDAATSNNGEGRIVRDANNKMYANNVSPEITVRIDASTKGNYQYTDWGAWNSTGHVYTANQEIEKGHWIIGRSTNVNDIPKTGSATYNGEIMGTSYSGENITGNVALTAQFAEQRVDGTFNFKRADGSDWIRAETGRMSYTDAANNHTHRINFQTQASTIYQNGNAINAGSNIRGSFFGKNAEEIGGEWAIWNVPDSVGGADGVFRAKQ